MHMKKSILFLSALLSFSMYIFCMDAPESSSASGDAELASSTSSTSAALTSAASAENSSPSASAYSPVTSTQTQQLTHHGSSISSSTSGSSASSAPTADSPSLPIVHRQRGALERLWVATARIARDGEDMLKGADVTVESELKRRQFREHDSFQCGLRNCSRLTAAMYALMQKGDVNALNDMKAKAQEVYSWDAAKTVIWEELHPDLKNNIDDYIRQRTEEETMKHEKMTQRLRSTLSPQRSQGSTNNSSANASLSYSSSSSTNSPQIQGSPSEQ